MRRVLHYRRPMVLDEFNYKDGCFCPLAVALGLDEAFLTPSDEAVFGVLKIMGYCVQNTRHVQGEFYRGGYEERFADLVAAVQEVLQEASHR